MATIKKRGKSFQLIISCGYDSNGKQIRKTRTFKPPEGVTEKKAVKLAERAAIEFENQYKNIPMLNENMKFSELTKLYIELYAQNALKPCTLYNYQTIIKSHFLPEFGSQRLKYINNTTISRWLNSLDIKPSTVHKMYTTLQSIFTFAVKQGYLKESPCKNITLPTKKFEIEEKKPIITLEQTRTLLKMLDESGYSEFAVIIKTLLFTGVRSSEALALFWENIDFDNNLIYIKYNLADVGGKHFIDTPKTKTSIRTIAISDYLKNVLLEHKEKQQEKIAKIGSAYYKYPELVFTSETGNYKDRHQLLKTFKRFIKDTDFCNITLHGLRHANATLLLYNGVDLKLVSEHLGHSSINVTADIYADVLMESKRKLADITALSLGVI